MRPQTTKDIEKHLRTIGEDAVADQIEHVRSTYQFKTYDEMHNFYRQGVLTEDQWEAYKYCWRNLAPRISNVAEEYDIELISS